MRGHAEGCPSPPGRAWPVSFASGLGLGMGCANCQGDFKSLSLFQGRLAKVSAAAEVCLLLSEAGQYNSACNVIFVYFAGPITSQ